MPRRHTAPTADASAQSPRTPIPLREGVLALVSHELRTPLTSLHRALQLAERRLRRGAAAPAVDALVLHADAQADRLIARVEELLDVLERAAHYLAITPATPATARLVAEINALVAAHRQTPEGFLAALGERLESPPQPGDHGTPAR